MQEQEALYGTDNIITAYVVDCNYRHIDNAAYKLSVEGLCNIRCDNSYTIHFIFSLVLCEFFSLISSSFNTDDKLYKASQYFIRSSLGND